MTKPRQQPKIAREGMTQGIALACLLILGGISLVGPSGILAWSDTQAQLEHRQQELAELREERARLRNLVKLLDPAHVDPDLSGELLRSQLNVAHPDEMVMLID